MQTIYHIQDIASHNWLAIYGLQVETMELVPDAGYATGWTDRADAEAEALRLMNDFSHPLAGVTFEVVPIHYDALGILIDV